MNKKKIQDLHILTLIQDLHILTLIQDLSSIEAPSSNHLWGAVWGCRKWSCAHARPEVESPEVASPAMTSPEPEVVNRKWKGDNFPRFVYPVFPAFFPNSSRFYVWTMELWIQPASSHYSAITPYAKPFFPPELCSQPWLIDSVVCVCNIWLHFLCSFVWLVFS